MNWQYILYRVDNGVAHVVLNRPEKLNALGMRMPSYVDHVALPAPVHELRANVTVPVRAGRSSGRWGSAGRRR